MTTPTLFLTVYLYITAVALEERGLLRLYFRILSYIYPFIGIIILKTLLC
jgi:hypothetical protein